MRRYELLLKACIIYQMNIYSKKKERGEKKTIV